MSRDPRVACQLEELTQGLRLSRISEGPYVTGRRLPDIRRKFVRMCEVCYVGTPMAHCGIWRRIQEVRDEAGGVHGGVNEAVMLHTEYKGACLHGEARVGWPWQRTGTDKHVRTGRTSTSMTEVGLRFPLPQKMVVKVRYCYGSGTWLWVLVRRMNLSSGSSKRFRKGTFPNRHWLFGCESETAQEICEQ